MFRRGGRGRRNNRGNGFLMLMLMQLGQRVHRLERKPPVTLALMGFMIFIYLQPDVAPSIGELCLSTSNVDVFRLIGSAFLHASDMHLYYNMSSLLWKGVQIELSAGSQIFAVMLSILLVLSHGLYIIVGNLVGDNLPFGGAAGCAVGFSAVLFALKVVLNEGSGTHSSVWGISVPTKYAAWLELVVASVISPRSSFLGHLCGILAGYIWVRGGLGQKVGELVPMLLRTNDRTNPTGTAEAWYNPVGMMRRNNPNQANGFFGGMGNMFSTLFGGDPGVPQQQQQQQQQYQQQNQQQQYQQQQQPQQYQQQQQQQQQNSGNSSQQASSGFFEGLSGLFGGASTAATQQQQQQGRTYGRGTTGNEDRHNNRSNDEEDERLHAAMEQSRAEYEQHQQRRQRETNRDREPSEVPPPVPSSGPSSNEELRRRRMARFN